MNRRQVKAGRGVRKRSLSDELELTSSRMQILNALDYPVARVYPENGIEWVNNVFFEYAEVPQFFDGAPDGDKMREVYEGRSILEFLPPPMHGRFEEMKREAKRLRTDLQDGKLTTFRIGVGEQTAFVSRRGKETPVQLSVTYAMKYDKYNLSFVDIANLKKAEGELLQAHEELERRVQERTAELQKANEEIRLQTQAILELSTPVIRIWRGILLMPLIGVIDTHRALQIEERLLQAVSELQAAVAILDVTGVPVIDTSVARHLLTTVYSAGMLGAKVIITGFSPEAAQTVVRLGVDFSKLRTRGTLQAGIAEALALTGLAIEQADGSAQKARRAEPTEKG